MDAREWKSETIPTPLVHSGFHVESMALNVAVLTCLHQGALSSGVTFISFDVSAYCWMLYLFSYQFFLIKLIAVANQ